MCFSRGNVFLKLCWWTMYLLGNLPFLRLMPIVLWPEMTHLVPMLSQNACCEWGVWCNSQFWHISFLSPHSSTLAWRIPWTEKPGRLQSMGSLSRTGLSSFTFTFHFHALEKEMATHSSVLAWRIPGTGEPGELPSMGTNEHFSEF